MPNDKPALLCVANFAANTGYAWDFIEHLYAQIADHLATHGIPTLVAYPTIPSPPRTLEGSAARAVELDASLRTAESVRATTGLIRRENVRVVYLSDQAAVSPAYLRLRWAGVRRILVHDHTSGERTRPRGLKRAAKWVRARIPGIAADVVVAVSEYVARRQIEVTMFPPSKIVRVWHGMLVVTVEEGIERRVREEFAVPHERPLVMCGCRATPEKGVQHLLRAFDRLLQGTSREGLRPALIYMGDGPYFAELHSLRDSLRSKGDIILAGYRADAARLLGAADLCVVPSVWQEAFGLAVLEAMARGKPVIATKVGGIPEIVEDGIHGLLVPPADEAALAEAIGGLLKDRKRAAQLGEAARRRVAEQFAPEQQLTRLTALVEEGFRPPCEAVRDRA